jgi:hypothetical protein
MSRTTFDNSLRAAAGRMADEARHRRWRDDPVAWAEDVLGVVLWSKQKEILRSIASNKRTAVKSCHSIGKSFTCGVAAAWWISTRDNCMVQSTAPTYSQVHAQLWEEIRKLHVKAGLIGRTTQGDTWLKPMVVNGRVTDVLVGEGKKPADTNIHGFHGTHRPDGVFAILDEGCGIATPLFTGAEAITTAGFDRQLTTGNPDDPNTEFGRIFREGGEQWNLITVSAFDTPLYTGEDKELLTWAAIKDRGNPDKPWTAKVNALLGGMPQPDWIEGRKRDWGEDSPRYLSKVLGEFPMTSVDSLFTQAEIEIGRNNVIEPTPTDFRVLGVDVARYGEDRSVIALNIGGKVEILSSILTGDTMELAAVVHKLALEHEIDQVRVDGIGPGGGVVDRLIALSFAANKPYVVVEMTASATPPDRTLHRNARAYWYDTLKHQLRNGLIDLPVDSKDAEQLTREMGGVRYTYGSGILQIESKEDIRRRGDKSPDYVDAVVMAAAPVSYVNADPLSTYRKGQMLDIDVLSEIEIVSPV